MSMQQKLLAFLIPWKNSAHLKLSHLIFAATEQLAITRGYSCCRQRTDKAFDNFYYSVVIDSKDVAAEPVLPRQRQPPKELITIHTVF